MSLETIPDEPIPIVGSKTVSFSFEYVSNIHSSNLYGFAVGCLLFLLGFAKLMTEVGKREPSLIVSSRSE